MVMVMAYMIYFGYKFPFLFLIFKIYAFLHFCKELIFGGTTSKAYIPWASDVLDGSLTVFCSFWSHLLIMNFIKSTKKLTPDGPYWRNEKKQYQENERTCKDHELAMKLVKAQRMFVAQGSMITCM